MPPWARHPAFAPFAQWLARLTAEDPPDVATLNGWARERGLALPDGRPLRFDPRRVAGALEYETTVRRDAIVPTREHDWHDAFNALAWLAFPRTKLAINGLHAGASRAPTANARTRARDRATLIDEFGVLLACDEPRLVQLLCSHAWRELFITHARDVHEHWRVAAVGHGLLDKLRKPYRALTAKTVVMRVQAGALSLLEEPGAFDERGASSVAEAVARPDKLPPLPIAALPGWDVEALGIRLFDDVSVFRPRCE